MKIRRRILEIETGQKGPHPCPQCNAVGVRRLSSGVWKCRRCGLTFAGGAYRPVVTTSVKREVPLVAEAGAEAAPEGEKKEAP